MEVVELGTNPETDLILTTPAEEVSLEEIPNFLEQVKEMVKLVKEVGAYGLAAPQVGIHKRFFVLNTGKAIFNPSIIAREGKITSHAEGCLSCGRGNRYDVKRSKAIVLVGINQKGEQVRIKTNTAREAMVLQHEVDHLNGILIAHKGEAK